MLYPPSRLKAPNRKHDDFLEASILGSNEYPVDGIKGKSILLDILCLPSGIPFDYMHLVIIGLFQNMMSLWFDKCNSKEKFYLGNV